MIIRLSLQMLKYILDMLMLTEAVGTSHQILHLDFERYVNQKGLIQLAFIGSFVQLFHA